MGTDKAMLPFGEEAMLTRVVRLLREVVPTVAVVAAAQQPLPALPSDVLILRDRQEGQGPLPALRLGLSALALHADAAYVTSCDAPLLQPAFSRRVLDRLTAGDGSADACVPFAQDRLQPLSAAYRTGVAPRIDGCIDDGVRSLVGLLERLNVMRLTMVDLADVDRDGKSLWNLNSRSDYAAALAGAGFPVPPDLAK